VLPRSGPEPWFEPNFGPVLTRSGPRSRYQPEPDHDMVLGSGRVRTVLLWFGPKAQTATCEYFAAANTTENNEANTN
jgi:hypothetical protein